MHLVHKFTNIKHMPSSVDEEKIITCAEQLLAEIQKTGLQEGVLRNQHVQDLIKDRIVYTLLLIIKAYSNSAVPLSSQLLQDDILRAASDLEALTPSIENYDLISKDLQHFTDLQGKKYTLALVIRLFDYRTT